MNVRVRCAHCGKQRNLSGTVVGHTIRCPACNQPFQVTSNDLVHSEAPKPPARAGSKAEGALVEILDAQIIPPVLPQRPRATPVQPLPRGTPVVQHVPPPPRERGITQRELQEELRWARKSWWNNLVIVGIVALVLWVWWSACNYAEQERRKAMESIERFDR